MLNADILMDHHGKSKGYGEVQFDDPSDAISAIGKVIAPSWVYVIHFVVCSLVSWTNAV